MVPRDAAVVDAGLLERAQESSAAATGGGFSRVPSPALFLRIPALAMAHKNFVTAYMNGGNRPSNYVRFDVPDNHWLDLQDRLNRWGGSKTWKQLQQLGQIAKTD